MDMHDGEMGMDHKCDCGEGCHCKGDMKSQWRVMKAVRALTAVIIVIFVFWCGFQFGEMRASVGRGYGFGMMRGGTMIEYGVARGGTTSSGTVSPAAPGQTGAGGTNAQ
jgi:hypothetical protein